jgi:Ca2+-binding EF-hand superfamily protein
MKRKLFTLRFFTVAFTLLVCYIYEKWIYPPDYTGTQTTNIAFLFLAGLAFLSNIGIIYYHITVPPHPKFLMMADRKFWIRTHAISGGLELILGIVAWYLMDKNLAIVVGAIAILGHVPASFFQSPGAFGAKGITVPAYFMIVAIHLYCASRLIMTGGDIVWLERTWITLQAYAFMRIYMIVLADLKVFKGSHYTVTEILAGTTIMPFLFGYSGVLLILFGNLFYLGLYRLLLKPSKEQWDQLFEEKERESLIDAETRNIWIAKHIATNPGDDKMKNARMVFNYFDKDKSGYISKEEIQDISREWGISENYMLSFIETYNDPRGIDYNTFLSGIWVLGNLQSEITRKVSSGIKDKKKQAEVVFNHLDLDASGYLELIEIEMLLLEWGLEPAEAKAYINKFAGEDKKIDFEEFYAEMKPIWSFGYKEMFA